VYENPNHKIDNGEKSYLYDGTTFVPAVTATTTWLARIIHEGIGLQEKSGVVFGTILLDP
jgi:hypothetical protein